MKKYCMTCGALMGYTRKVWMYDEETGRPQYEYKFACPNNRFWRIGHSTLTIYSKPGRHEGRGPQDFFEE